MKMWKMTDDRGKTTGGDQVFQSTEGSRRHGKRVRAFKRLCAVNAEESGLDKAWRVAVYRVLVHSTAIYGVLVHSMHSAGDQGTAVSNAEPYAMDILMGR